MEKFRNLKSIPAYLSLMNVDTDMIIPKQFLKTIKRTGLGKSLFYEMRYNEENKLIKDFILNNEPYSNSKILLTGKNFHVYRASYRAEKNTVSGKTRLAEIISSAAFKCSSS